MRACYLAHPFFFDSLQAWKWLVVNPAYAHQSGQSVKMDSATQGRPTEGCFSYGLGNNSSDLSKSCAADSDHAHQDNRYAVLKGHGPHGRGSSKFLHNTRSAEGSVMRCALADAPIRRQTCTYWFILILISLEIG